MLYCTEWEARRQRVANEDVPSRDLFRSFPAHFHPLTPPRPADIANPGPRLFPLPPFLPPRPPLPLLQLGLTRLPCEGI